MVTTRRASREQADTAKSSSTATLWFLLLAFCSVTMTIGNKFLMMSAEFKGQSQLVASVQHVIAIVVVSAASPSGSLKLNAINRKQLTFYVWDAVVRFLQIWTSLEALRHVPIAATTVVRALAVPTVAWVEWLVLRARLGREQQLWSCAVVLGAAVYAYEDVIASGYHALGYAWAFGNLIFFVSNCVLGRVMMSQNGDQSASGMAVISQSLSIPIFLGQATVVDGLTVSSAYAVLSSLDTSTKAILLLTGATAGLLGTCYAECYKRASASAVTLATNGNKALCVLVSVAVFGLSLSVVQFCGLVLTFGAALGYSLVGARAKEKAW